MVAAEESTQPLLEHVQNPAAADYTSNFQLRQRLVNLIEDLDHPTTTSSCLTVKRRLPWSDVGPVARLWRVVVRPAGTYR